MSLSSLLPHKLIANIQIPVKVQPCRFVVEVGAGLAFVKQLQRLRRLDVQPPGQLNRDGAVVSTQVATNVIITCVLDISMTFFITNECFVFYLAKIYFFRIMQVVSKRLPHQTPNKSNKRLDLPLHARLLQCRHVLFPALHGDHHPRIAGGHELAVHHEAGGAAVAVHVGMDIDDEEVT